MHIKSFYNCPVYEESRYSFSFGRPGRLSVCIDGTIALYVAPLFGGSLRSTPKCWPHRRISTINTTAIPVAPTHKQVLCNNDQLKSLQNSYIRVKQKYILPASSFFANS